MAKSFVLLLLCSLATVAFAQSVTRGPYLQLQTDDSITVHWRTDLATDSVVRYGDAPDNLVLQASLGAVTTEHVVALSGLGAGQHYWYSVGDGSEPLAGDASYHFYTAPTPGTPAATRIWVIGDSGTANVNARAVRDAYKTWAGAQPADLWLMLGDNAYNDGTDAQYQAAVFNTYPEILRQLPLWPTLGNHDGHSADSTTQSGPYYDIFDLPTAAEAGGLASGTEAYYSFDYANIHFICLDSYDSDRSVGGTMLNWLEADLAVNTQPWVIAFWHHPPYSKGSHNSDTEAGMVQMRQNALPVLEAWGVDLVLSGHSHSYERSMLLDGHYGVSTSLDPVANVLDPGDGRESGDGAYAKPDIVAAEHAGAVYAVAGSSGKTSGGALDHPAMYISLNSLGSMVLDVDGSRLDATFIDQNGAVQDSFTLLKSPDLVPPVAGFAASCTDLDCGFTDTSTDSDGFVNGWSWNFGDGGSSSAQNPVHSYAAAGDYTVTLDVTDNDGLGDSFSDIVSVTAPAGFTDQFAQADLPAAGSVSGTYLDTQGDDGVAQVITERRSGGKKSRRYSYLSHSWRFNVVAGSTVTLYANAWSGGSGDGDQFRFAWSTDNSNFSDAFTIGSTEPTNLQSAVIPASGTVYVRVTDSDRTAGHKVLDSIYVDQLFIRSDSTVPTAPPPAPQNLAIAGTTSNSITLSWSHDDTTEQSFDLQRAPAGGGSWSLAANPGAGSSSHTDTGLAPGMSYDYRIRAANSAGDSAWSNTATGSTDAAASITLSASGYKVRGVHHVDLNWSGNGTVVDILRDGTVVASGVGGSSYTDVTGNKGGRTYVYRVCETGSSTCSDDAIVAF